MASGFCRTIKVWKGILIIWLTSLFTVSLIAIPVKNFLKAGFGNSMVTERLLDGPDIAALGDLGDSLKNIVAALPSGLILVILLGVILNAFLAGGIFDALKGTGSKFTVARFFSASSENFWSFLVISLIISIIIIILSFFIIGLPVSIVSGADSPSEGASFITTVVASIVFLVLSVIFLSVADYARAWQVTQEKKACFRALGFGFTRAFGTFLSSFPLIILIVILQLIFSFFVMKLIGGWRPATGGGVFLLFLMSQVLFFIKTGIKVWRYGSMTALKEINDNQASNCD